jgi:LDH2 family malate/lactate/ureidoglycolate dehydrogenase
MILTVQQAHALARAAMVGVGHSEEESTIIADHLVDCELRGLSFGGLPRALSIAERIQQVGLSRRPISVVRDSPISATIDGGDQVGYLVAHRATDLAIEKAKTTGIAVVGAHATWYTGMFSYYLERVTRAGFAGMAAGSAWQRVAPHGGTEARFGTNPIAFGFRRRNARWHAATDPAYRREYAASCP